MKYLLFISFLFILNQQGYCQDSWKVWSDKYCSNNELDIQQNLFFNAITIVFKSDIAQQRQLLSNGKIYKFNRDIHVTFRNQSELIIFPKKINSFQLMLDNFRDSIEIFFQYCPDLQFDYLLPRNNDLCDSPPVMPQSVWRVGLPEPDYTRLPNDAMHCIIHHADSPNWDSNYVSLTRAFYLQHTQVNGWSDIGYNYLIAWDGTVIAGRDPDSSGLAQDEVLGAHFCGKNSGTLGICMIGNYMDIRPSAAAIHSLIKLLSWKLNKSHLAALDSSIHSGGMLPVIAGHRDGCSTLCPGDSLYVLIPAIRDSVAVYLDACNSSATKSYAQINFEIFPNPITNNSFYIPINLIPTDQLIITNSMGEKIPFTMSKSRIELNNFIPPGIYICMIRSMGEFYISKLIKI